MSTQLVSTENGVARPAWAEPIARELRLVERKLAMTVASEIPAAFDIAGGLLSAGGKRIRPALVILSARAVGHEFDEARAANIGAAVELIHMASLVHDDVIDSRAQRRGAEAANSQWGNKLSVLGGDLLLAKALYLIARDGDPRVLGVISEAAVAMSEGEFLQAACEGSLALWEANYHRIVRDKTAALLAACCECGGVISGADERQTTALRDCGMALGLAFQIADDVLDFIGDPAITGKDRGTDIANGRFTLPVLIAARESEPDLRPRLLAALDRDVISAADALQIAALLAESPAVDRALEVALRHSEDARTCAALLPASRWTDALAHLADYAASRRS